ncbi:MAG: delta-60 repeat domain-containing protein, partial [Deltaproteobacteria bacterium]|nr:delta-60 repeat domain-containing protein [Deltaproteobacteria bacterium]
MYDFGGSEAGVGTAVQSDGRIVIAGSTNDRGDDDDLFVVRIRPD